MKPGEAAFEAWQDRWGYGFVAAAVLTIFLGLYGVFWYATLDRFPALLPALAVTAALALPVFGVYGLAAKSQGQPARRLRPHAALTLLLIFGAFYGGFVFANAALDRSEPVSHETVVMAKRKTGLTGSEYHLDLRSWRNGRQTETKRTSKDAFDFVEAGQPVIARTHAGAFGWERWWIAGVHDDLHEHVHEH